MNRRDMIIVAVLMNTGILAVLFMMAMHTDDGAAFSQTEVQTVVAEAPKMPVVELLPPVQPMSANPQLVANTSPHDALDNAIEAFSAGPASEVVVLEESAAKEPASTMAGAPVVIEPESKYLEVAVKRGDSLDKIARANSTTIKALMRANNLSSDRLQIGQVLRVPAGGERVGADKPSLKEITSAFKPSDTAEYYTIKGGDNPWKIAKKFHVRFNDLLKLNNLDEEKARKLKAGDKIRVK